MPNKLQSFVQRALGLQQKKLEAPKGNLVPFSNILAAQFYGDDFRQEQYLNRYRSWVYAAVSKIAQDVSAIELTLNQKNKNGDIEPVKNNPVLDLLDSVNPFITYYDLAETTITYKELTGNAFWWLIKGKDGAIIEIYPWLRPDRMKVIPSEDQFIAGYSYHVPGTSKVVKFAVDEIIHFKDINPLDPYYGMGPLQAALDAVLLDEEATRYNKNFFKNSARPDMILSFEDGLNEEQVKQIRAQWENSHGRGHEHRLGIISRGKPEIIGLAQKDMEFLEQRRFSRDEILAMFKVPKAILDPQEINYASALVAKKVFIEEVVTPKMRKFVGMLNEFLLPHYGRDDLFFDFIPPQIEDPDLKLRRYQTLTNVGAISPNEIREQENLEPIDGGDDIRVPTGGGGLGDELLGKAPRKPLQQKANVRTKHRSTTADLLASFKEKLTDVKDSALEKKGHIKSTPEHQKSGFEIVGERIWNRKIQKTNEDEKEMRALLVGLFKGQEKRVLASLREKAVGVRFDIEAEEKLFLELFIPYFTELMKVYGDDALAQLGLDDRFELTKKVREYIKTSTGKFAGGVNETTEAKIRSQIAEGVDKGEGIAKIRRRIQGVFEGATTSRAEAIARTEVSRASNYSTLESWKQSGIVKAKQWFTAEDERVDEAICAPLHGQIFRDLDAEIETGDEIFPEIEEPPAHVNCRCVMIPLTRTRSQLLRETKDMTDQLKSTIETLKTEGEKTVQEVKQQTEKEVQKITETRQKVEDALAEEAKPDDGQDTEKKAGE